MWSSGIKTIDWMTLLTKGNYNIPEIRPNSRKENIQSLVQQTIQKVAKFLMVLGIAVLSESQR